MKPILKDLSTALLRFHRGLLVFQTNLIEAADDRKYTPYDVLNLSLNDVRFAWLRKFSELIVHIDTIVDDKKDSPFNAHDIVHSVKKLISLNTTEDAAEILAALKADSSIMLPLGDVRKHVQILETALQTPHSETP